MGEPIARVPPGTKTLTPCALMEISPRATGIATPVIYRSATFAERKIVSIETGPKKFLFISFCPDAGGQHGLFTCSGCDRV